MAYNVLAHTRTPERSGERCPQGPAAQPRSGYGLLDDAAYPMSNESDEEVSLVCFADMPDLDHVEQPIPRLLPGAMATRTFLIPDAIKWLGQFLRVGLYDPRGTDRVNYQIEIN